MERMCLEIAAALLLLCWTTSVHAQAPTRDPDLTLIESTERNEDPLGLDEATGRGLEEAARALPAAKGPPPPASDRGDVLTTIAGIEERSHSVRIELAQGLAFVEVTLAFENRTPHAAQLAYRLAVPEDAVPLALALCAGACQDTASFGAAPPASATLSPIQDGRGKAFALLVSRARDALKVRIRYVAAAEVMGGRVSWTYPARGFDPRIAAAEIHAEAPAMSLVSEADAVVDASREHAVQALVRAARSEKRTRATCGAEDIERIFRTAAHSIAAQRPTWLLLDASPSMEGPARSRAPLALAALLETLPENTPLTVFAFGAKVTRVGSFSAGDANLTKLSELLYEEHGSATKLAKVFEPNVEALRSQKPRIVVLSDGKFDATKAEREALERARKRGAELWLIDLADGPLEPHVRAFFAASGGVLSVGSLAERALSSSVLERLADALSPIAARELGAGLRAGSQQVQERRTRARVTHKKAQTGNWLCAWTQRAQMPLRVTGPEETAAAIVAPPYQSVAPKAAPPDTGMPKESVLSLLRGQLIPRARACLRSDRKGRGDYAVGLSFRMTLARREVADAQIVGDVPPALKSCLLELLDDLRLPWFSGRLLVNYPIHTEREPEPPTIELAPEVAETIERAMKATKRDEPALPPR
jgi:hypothetical protein